jgi:hypothetical protein
LDTLSRQYSHFRIHPLPATWVSFFNLLLSVVDTPVARTNLFMHPPNFAPYFSFLIPYWQTMTRIAHRTELADSTAFQLAIGLLNAVNANRDWPLNNRTFILRHLAYNSTLARSLLRFSLLGNQADGPHGTHDPALATNDLQEGGDPSN